MALPAWRRLLARAGALVPAALLVASAGCGPAQTTPTGPTADFTIAPICDLMAAITVASTSKPGDAKIVQYVWSFSDGTSAIGQTQDHRFMDVGTTPAAIGGTLTVTDANGLGDAKQKLVDQGACLSVVSQRIDDNGTSVTPHAQVKNVSTYGDALVAFSLDIVGKNGLPLVVGLDGGQHPIKKGQTVDVGAVGPFVCGSSCADLLAGTVVPHVRTTYWCSSSLPCQ